MAMTLKDIREKYPQYSSKTDTELADAIHNKYYSSLPKEKVYEKLGLQIAEEPQEHEAAPERTGLLGVASDVARGTGNALKGGIKFSADIPNKLEKSGEYIQEHPGSSILHNVGQLAAEFADIGKGIINSPYNLNQYLARKHLLPQLVGKLGKVLIPRLPEDTGVEKALGLEADVKKGDELIRAIPNVITTILGGKSIGKQVKKVVSAPSKEALFKQAIEDKISIAEKEHNLSKGDLDALKDSLRLEYSKVHNQRAGELTPVGQEESINVKQGKLEKLKPFTEIPEQKVGEIPPEPDTKAIIDQKKSALEKARTEADKALGTLDNPRLKGGAKVKKAIDEVHDSAADLYNSARKHYVDQKISADNTSEIKSVTKDLEALKDADELAPGYGSGTAEQKSLEAQLQALKGEKVNASDIFDLQRTLEKMAQDTRKKQYSGVNELEFKRLGNLSERLDAHADKLATRLEEVGGKEVQSMMKAANKGWKTYKDLSNRNPVGKAALKGELPTRAMIEIAKNHPGNDFLHALVESDPELKKHMLAAYTGESNANKLLKPTSLTKKYIEALPEVEEHVNALKEALQGVKEGEVKAAKVKKEYDDLVSSMKDAAKEQKVRQDAIQESETLQKQIKDHKANIPKLEAKIKTMREKGENVAKLKEELANHENELKLKGGRLKKLGHFLLKAKGIQAFGNKLGL